jgi:uncharacterized membrane protein YphA (DoxX/SURF4 family)
MDGATTLSASPIHAPYPRWPRWLLLAGRLILGVVFAYAGYAKLRAPWMLFAFSINSYQILPGWAVPFLARTLPWFELALGLLLLLGWHLRWSALAAAGLLGVLLSAVVDAYHKNLDIDCGCFGFGEKLGPLTIARDALLLALAVAVVVGAIIFRRRKTEFF